MKRPKRIATNLGRLASMTYSVAPGINNMFMSIGFRLFPSSDAAKAKAEKLNWVQKHMHAFSQVSIGNLKYSANLNKKRLMKGAFYLILFTHLKIRHALF